MKTSQVLTRIIKRNGVEDDFNLSKITTAIQRAGEASGEFSYDVAQALTLRVLNLAQQLAVDRYPTVEEVQDIVEEILLSSPYKKTAKSYIIYRDQHKQIREITSKSSVELVDQYLKRADWKVNENSNMGFSLQGLNQYISSEISKT
ncbi:MAG: ribonucleoside triphosphate reductase, partial [Candidatus Omnitrophica bacterium]|nr:ribonucleoside triphosphate reductase [Candidatus Omnitrophota bacterium]